MCDMPFKTSEQLDKFAAAFAAASAEIHPAGKSGSNQYDKYDYAKEEDWYNAVKPALVKHGLAIMFSCPVASEPTERKTKNGGIEYRVSVSGAARLLHTSGQWMEWYGVGEGEDRGDKAAYKAITGMKKYLYALGFAIPTTDDPEVDSHEPADVDQDAERIERNRQKALDDIAKVKGWKPMIDLMEKIEQSGFDDSIKAELAGELEAKMHSVLSVEIKVANAAKCDQAERMVNKVWGTHAKKQEALTWIQARRAELANGPANAA